MESSTIGAADATDKLAESTEGVGEASKQAAKDMKGAQAGFDELNILANKAASSMEDAAGGIGDVGGTGDFDIPEFEADTGNFEEFEKEFETLGELFVDTLDKMLAAMPAFRDALLNFADNFNEFNQKLYDAFTFPGVKERVEELGRELAESFNDLVNAIDWELWGRTLGAGLNLGLQFLTEFLYTFDWINLGEQLAAFINGLVDEVDWYDFGRLLWAKFKIALETFAGFIIGLDMPALAQAASDIIIGFFNSMQETIAKIDWAAIGRQIAEFLNNIDWAGVISSIANAIGELIPAALELIGGFIQNADTGTLIAAALFLGSKLLPLLLGKVISPIAKQIGSDLIKQIAAAITGGESGSLLASISGIFSKIASSVGPVLAAIGKISLVIGGVVTAALAFFDMWNNGFSLAKEAVMLVGIALAAVGAALLGVNPVVAAVIAGIVAVVATAVIVIREHWDEIKEAALNAWEGIKEAWSAAGEWFNKYIGDPIKEVFRGIAEKFSEVVEQHIKPMVEKAVELFKKLFGALKDLWDNILAPLVTWIVNDVVSNISSALEFIGNVFNTLLSTICDVVGGILEAIGGVIDFLVGVFTGDWEKAWKGIKEIFSGIWNGIIGALEGAINLIIHGVNWLVAQLNKISFDVPDWVPAIGGKKFGFNVSHVSEVKLPRLTNGAVIPPNQQFAAILGDQRSGMNLEAPAGLIKQMVVEGMQAVMAQGGFGRGGNMTVVLEVDKREWGRATVEFGGAEYQRIGTKLVEART